MAPRARLLMGKAGAIPDHICDNHFAYLKDHKIYSRKYTKDKSATKGFGCIHYPLASRAVPPRCAATCSACSAQYRPVHWQEDLPVCRYINKYSDAEALDIVQRHIADTKQNLEYIATRIESHGNALVKRWLKRPVQKRSTLLLQAMPGMFRYRSDLHEVSKLCCGDLTQHRNRLLIPYLNVDLLSEEPLHLLALLHHRATATPSDWIMFDSQHLKESFAQGALEASYNPHCVALSANGEPFGSLVPWDEERAHQWQIVGFPRAELILEAQKVLSKFLADVVSFLCPAGTDMGKPGRNKWDQLVACDFTSDTDTDTPSISSYRFGAFVAPPMLSLEHIVESFETRLQAANDESALLQTDPAFTRQILAIAESSNAHKHGCECCSVPSLLSLMSNGVSRHRFWRSLQDDAQHALEVCQRHQLEFGSSQLVPGECLQAIRNFEFLLECDFKYLIEQLRRLALELGVVDDHLKFGGNDVPEYVSKRATRDPVFKALNHLHGHAAPESGWPCYNLAILDHYTSEAHPNNHAKFSYGLTECLADMHAVDEALMAIKYSRPNCGPRRLRLDNSNSTARRTGAVTEDELRYLNYLKSRWPDFDSVLWPALDDFMKAGVPTDKVSRKTLEHFDASHQTLASFWDKFRDARSQLLYEAGCPQESHDGLMEILQPSTSAEYYEGRDKERTALVEAIERKERAEIERKERSTRKENTSLRDLSIPPQTFWGERISTSPLVFHPTSSKKEKRRDSAQPQTPPSDNTAPLTNDLNDLNINDNKGHFTVSARAYDIFRRMFVSFGKYTNSNLPWGYLVNAMAEADVTTKEAEGSRVTFRQAKAGKGLVLHRPHSDSVNPIMLRRFGKRFEQHWGWDLEMFAERG